jgi:hypothetical protein
MTDAETMPVIDRTRVERWASQLVGDDLSDAAATFRGSYGQAPSAAWNPQLTDLPHERLRFLLTYWMTLRRGHALPRTGDIDPLQMGPVLGYLALVDAEADGRDFRYRLYGATLSAISGFDMTGRLLSTLNASPLMVEFILATYRAAVQRHEPIYTVRTPRRALDTAYWHSICMPLTDDNGTVVRFLTGAMPLGHDGRLLSSRF